MLKSLSTTQQRLLACDYAEHTSWIIPDKAIATRTVSEYLNACRAYVQNGSNRQSVLHWRDAFNEYLFAPADLTPAEVEAANLVNTVCSVCCREVLVEDRKINPYNEKQWSCLDVARSCANAVAYYYGSEDWDSEDPDKRAAAKQYGNSQAVKEITWQIAQAQKFV